MTDAFEEVEENLRRDQYVSWLRQYGLWAGIGIVLLLGGVLGWQQFQNWRSQQAGEYARKLQDGHKFFEQHDYLAAQRFYEEMAKSAPGPYKAAALQFAAEALYAQGDEKQALGKLDEAAAAAPDKFLKDAAKLKAAYMAADLQDYKTVAPRLNALVDGGGPLSYQAREVLGAEAFEAGDYAKAREQFDFISKALDAPPGVRQRARSALVVIASAQNAPTSTKPAGAATGGASQ